MINSQNLDSLSHNFTSDLVSRHVKSFILLFWLNEQTISNVSYGKIRITIPSFWLKTSKMILTEWRSLDFFSCWKWASIHATNTAPCCLCEPYNPQMYDHCHLTLRNSPKATQYSPKRLFSADIRSRASVYLLSSTFSALKLRTVRIPLSDSRARLSFSARQSWIFFFSSCLTQMQTYLVIKCEIWLLFPS